MKECKKDPGKKTKDHSGISMVQFDCSHLFPFWHGIR